MGWFYFFWEKVVMRDGLEKEWKLGICLTSRRSLYDGRDSLGMAGFMCCLTLYGPWIVKTNVPPRTTFATHIHYVLYLARNRLLLFYVWFMVTVSRG